ncbi:hypothetical protein B0H14DRAFT_2585506 [Mycena olivaceomarginata]|nr:hypothetical protein B0H14DRAFT_2609238 [Mycena olivaceomarginata]KAJ7843925.1 hypothetical protein B0H14DRAFT_2585506 [Mycena olivaceomarginata]
MYRSFRAVRIRIEGWLGAGWAPNKEVASWAIRFGSLVGENEEIKGKRNSNTRKKTGDIPRLGPTGSCSRGFAIQVRAAIGTHPSFMDCTGQSSSFTQTCEQFNRLQERVLRGPPLRSRLKTDIAKAEIKGGQGSIATVARTRQFM